MTVRRGVLVVFEGIDGSGKSTQAKSLLGKLRRLGYPAVLFREPTRGRWGREIKRLAARAGSLTPEEELERNLRPALERGKIVLLDRYYFSTIAYQGAKGIDTGRIRRLNEAFAVKPDLVIVLDIGARRGLARIAGRKTRDELFEREDYLVRVGDIFRELRGPNIMHLDGGGDRRAVGRAVWARVQTLLPK
jgi:dTMP kinase